MSEDVTMDQVREVWIAGVCIPVPTDSVEGSAMSVTWDSSGVFRLHLSEEEDGK